MDNYECYVCNQRQKVFFCETSDYITEENFKLSRCTNCGLIFVDPQPIPEEIARYYPQTHQRTEPAQYEKMDAKPRIKFVSDLSNNQSSRILDIGCGKGLLLSGLKEKGWEVYGTELSTISSRIAQQSGIKVYNLPLDECNFKYDSFDVITLYHSLEHMFDPKKILLTSYHLLKPGGFLVVEVPNIGSWYAKIFSSDWFHFDVPRHLFHFNRSNLKLLLEICGFKIYRESTHNIQYDSFGAVQSLLNKIFIRQKNLLNNFNTGEITFREICHGNNRIKNLSALFFSEVMLGIGFPFLAMLSIVLSPWVKGGTLRFIATKNN